VGETKVLAVTCTKLSYLTKGGESPLMVSELDRQPSSTINSLSGVAIYLFTEELAAAMTAGFEQREETIPSATHGSVRRLVYKS